MRTLLLCAVAVLLIAAEAALAGPATRAEAVPAPAAAVVDPLVTTDKSIDCSTVDNILAGLIRKDMTDQQKVLACFDWIRRVLYHGDGPIQYAYNFHHMVNVFGHGSCLRQTTPMWVLLDRLGYECRTGAVGGHHIIEVKYGGAWHLFDPHMNFYVYDRGKPASIISIEQIKADPTLVTDAVKEGRACPGFLLCGDSPKQFADGNAFKILGGFPEAKKYTPVITEPFGRITLRRGEAYVRTWMPGPYWFKGNWDRKDEGPRHGCGLTRDGKDTVNLPLYEPHAAGRTYRHWGAGYLLYKPSFSGEGWRDAVVSRQNVVAGGGGVAGGAAGGLTTGLTTEDASKPGEVTFSVNCPYVITAGELKFTALGEGVAASVSNDQGKTWHAVPVAPGKRAVATSLPERINGSFDGYWLKLSLPAGARVEDLELKSHFQLNPYSLPYLVPGKNVVAVKATRFGSPVKLEWKYAEGPEWKEPKTASQTFDKPGEMTIDVKGEKYPRNVELTLSVAP